MGVAVSFFDPLYGVTDLLLLAGQVLNMIASIGIYVFK